MKKSAKNVLGLCLTAAIITSSVICTSGQTATTKNEIVQCKNGVCTFNSVFFGNAKNNSVNKAELAKSTNNIAVTKKTAATKEICNEYTFIGKGGWQIASNWTNNIIPPSTIGNGDRIVIDGVGPCLYNSMEFFNATEGSSIEIKTGKMLYVNRGDSFKFKGGTLINNGTLSVLSGTFAAPEDAGGRETSGKITTNKFSNIIGSESEVSNYSYSGKRVFDNQGSKEVEFHKLDPSFFKINSKQ
jgi:hypothetical protein